MRRQNPESSVLQPAQNPWGLDLWILRADAAARHLGGNKGYKLRGYLERARREGITKLITMAGPHSNHLRAFAALARQEALDATAIVRGDELADTSRHSDEIRFALACGVRLVYATRLTYRAFRDTSTLAGRQALLPDLDFAGALFIPEGGFGPDGLKGVIDWAAEAQGFDAIFVPCATGTTCAGFLAATRPPTQIYGVAVLRNAAAVHAAMANLVPGAVQRFTLLEGYAAGRFGRGELPVGIIAEFASANKLVADPIYTVRLLRALQDFAAVRPVTGRVLIVYTYNE